MDLNTTSINELVDLVERDWSVYNKFPEQGIAQQLFIYDDLSSHRGESKRYTEIDTEMFASLKPEGEDASIATVQQGYTVTMTARRFAKEISITYEMRRVNKKPEVVTQLHNMTHFCPNRKEIDLTHRIGFATATSYVDMDGQTITTTVGDGLALVSAVHTLRGTATTFSNVVTGNPQFSKGGLEVAENQARNQILSQFGERRVMNFNTIFSSDHPNTVNNIKQFVQSTTDVDQNNPMVVNVYKGKYRHIVMPYLATLAAGANDSTKDRYWGLVAAGQGQNGWQAYFGMWDAPSLQTPSKGNNGEDVHNDNWTFGSRCMYGIATVSPRGFLLSTGLGA